MEERRKKISCTNGIVGDVMVSSFELRYCLKVPYLVVVSEPMAVAEKS